MTTKRNIPFLHKLILAVIAMTSMFAASAQADYASSVSAENPVVWYRFSETSGTALTNSGSATQTTTAGGTVILGSSTPGPRPATYPGLESGNLAGHFIADSSSIVTLAGAGTGGLWGGIVGQSGITLSTWIDPTVLPAVGGEQDTILNLTHSSGSTGLQVALKLGGIEMAGRSDTGDAFINTTWTYALDVGAGWYNVTSVWDFSAQTMALYVNGTQVGSDFDASIWGSSTFNFAASNSNGSVIGASSGGVNNFQGDMDEFAIFNSALSSSQISALYNAAVVPEPSTAMLLLGGTISLWVLGHRRRK